MKALFPLLCKFVLRSLTHMLGSPPFILSRRENFHVFSFQLAQRNQLHFFPISNGPSLQENRTPWSWDPAARHAGNRPPRCAATEGSAHRSSHLGRYAKRRVRGGKAMTTSLERRSPVKDEPGTRGTSMVQKSLVFWSRSRGLGGTSMKTGFI